MERSYISDGIGVSWEHSGKTEREAIMKYHCGCTCKSTPFKDLVNHYHCALASTTGTPKDSFLSITDLFGFQTSCTGSRQRSGKPSTDGRKWKLNQTGWITNSLKPVLRLYDRSREPSFQPPLKLPNPTPRSCPGHKLLQQSWVPTTWIRAKYQALQRIILLHRKNHTH